MKKNIILVNSNLGIKTRGTEYGPKELMQNLNIENVYNINKPIFKGIIGVNIVNKRLYKLSKKVLKDNFLITIGGDHSIAIGSALASISLNNNMGIIWIDAHADYNTFNTTLTGNIHGMPLSAINGDEQKLTKFHNGNYYDPKKTVIIGCRDLDEAEVIRLKEFNVNVFPMNKVKELGLENVLKEAYEIASLNTNGIHISYDIDSIDPSHAPGVSTPVVNGFTENEAYLIAKFFSNKQNIKSFDLVELNPLNDENNKTLQIASNIIKIILD
jgi:arginase